MKKPVDLTDNQKYQLVLDYLDGRKVESLMHRYCVCQATVYKVLNLTAFRLLRWEKIPKKQGGATFFKSADPRIMKARLHRWRKSWTQKNCSKN